MKCLMQSHYRELSTGIVSGNLEKSLLQPHVRHYREFSTENVSCNLITEIFSLTREIYRKVSWQTAAYRKCSMQSHNRMLPTGNVLWNSKRNHFTRKYPMPPDYTWIFRKGLAYLLLRGCCVVTSSWSTFQVLRTHERGTLVDWWLLQIQLLPLHGGIRDGHYELLLFH